MRDDFKDLRVFVVDDEPILLMAVEDILQDLGCKIVATAGSVEAALDAVSALDFQLAILDVTLGRDQIDPVAQAIAGKNIPIIFATGLQSQEIAKRFGDATIVVEKPYAAAAIEAAVLRVLAQKTA